jgi:transcription antitermination factor NusG
MVNQVCSGRTKTESVPRVAPAQSIAESFGTWLVLASPGPLATQLDLRDRYGVWSYVPLREFRRYRNGEKNGWDTQPLFGGYVFARAPAEIVCEAKRARLVYGSVPVANQEKLTSELAAVERMLSISPRVEFSTNFIVGVKVKILDGPYRGQVGNIITKDKRDLFAVLLRESLGGAVMTDIAASRMELAE